MALRPNNDLAGAVVFRVQQLLADLLAQRCITTSLNNDRPLISPRDRSGNVTARLPWVQHYRVG